MTTMDIDSFRAKQTLLHCPHNHGTFKSTQLQNLVPKGGTFGFDVIIEIGYSLFVFCRSNQETMAALATRNISISEREISYMGRKFIIYLALAHRQSQPILREFLMRVFYNRKKTGAASLNKVLKSILAETPLVQNLKSDEYMNNHSQRMLEPGGTIFTN